MEREQLPYVLLGAAAAGERRTREIASTGVRAATIAAWPVARLWRSQLADPVRLRAGEASSGLARDGRDLAARAGVRARREGADLVRWLDGQLRDSGLADEIVDWLLNTGAFDRVVTVVINHPRTEMLVTNTLDDPGLDRLLARVMESRMLDELTGRLLESSEFQQILDRVIRSPELRAALTHQTAGLAEDVAVGMRSRTFRADATAERVARALVRRPRRPEGE